MFSVQHFLHGVMGSWGFQVIGWRPIGMTLWNRTGFLGYTYVVDPTLEWAFGGFTLSFGGALVGPQLLFLEMAPFWLGSIQWIRANLNNLAYTGFILWNLGRGIGYFSRLMR